LIYSVIAPLILVFNVITFTLFWFVYRYNTLYVTKFSFDTGGLLYPNAINYTFVGLYTMEFALIGMFFLVRDVDNNTACAGQGIAMVAVLICTAVYQWLLNSAFAPLFRYIPITLEDDAVARDEEFARAMGKKHAGLVENEQEGEDLNDALSERECRSLEEDRQAEEYEMQRINKKKNRTPTDGPDDNPLEPTRTYARVGYFIKDKTGFSIPGRPDAKRNGLWADRERNRDRRSKNFGKYPVHHHHSESPESRRHHAKPSQPKALDVINNFNPLMGHAADVEAQRQERSAFSNALFSGINDELEDLTPEERDVLVQRAFQHSALRARRPVIWIPRDGLGVSDDEVLRMGRFSKFLWCSNEKQGLDRKGRCVYSGSPPDFSEVDLIQL
jgi:calcium permeable stress-gated cation channel